MERNGHAWSIKECGKCAVTTTVLKECSSLRIHVNLNYKPYWWKCHRIILCTTTLEFPNKCVHGERECYVLGFVCSLGLS